MTRKGSLGSKPAVRRAWRIATMVLACAVVYYLPSIAGLAGFTSLGASINRLHDFYGLDFYALAFFIPIVYSAYTVGIVGTLMVALATLVLVMPHALIFDDYKYALFRPTGFTIILSAVGAVVAMLQKSDQQRQRSTSELKCLFDIGKAAQESGSVTEFVSSTVEIVPHSIRCGGETEVKIAVRDLEQSTPGFQPEAPRITEPLIGGGETIGRIELYSTAGNGYLNRQSHMVKTLANRIGSAVHEIELQQSVNCYYEQLEETVEKRTRELEQAQEKLVRSERLAAVGELASGVGHELRNPLNVIRNCVYLLNMTLNGTKDAETAGILKLVDQQVDSANGIVTDLLDFTRVKQPSPASIDLNALVKERLNLATVPSGVTITTNFNGHSPVAFIDGEQVGRAFANVISNAIEAMTDGGKLTITSGTEAEVAWVRFEDTGCGISEENLQKIFEPLFTTKPKGIGLGMAITKRLVEQNRGNVEVRSQVGQGTAFTLRLPVTNQGGN